MSDTRIHNGVPPMIENRIEQAARTPAADSSAGASEPMIDFWLDSHDDRDGWRYISCAQHGGFMRIVWKMEDDERSPECETRAKWVIDALNAYPTPAVVDSSASDANIDELGIKAGLLERVGPKGSVFPTEASAYEVKNAIRYILTKANGGAT